jgi:hypothetical protein
VSEENNKIRSAMICMPNIVRVIKLKGIIWARHATCMGDSRGERRVLEEKRKGKGLL